MKHAREEVIRLEKDYITERVVNIGELEKIIENTYALVQGMQKESSPEQKENFQVLISNLKKMSEFDFCVERRKTLQPEKTRNSIFIDMSLADNCLITKIATCDLVDELSRREGVKRIDAEPYQQKTVDINGPAIILTVID